MFIKRLSVYTTVKSFVWLPFILPAQFVPTTLSLWNDQNGCFSSDFNGNAKKALCTQWTIFGVCAVPFLVFIFNIIPETSWAMQYGIIKYYYISRMKDYQRQGRSRTNALKRISSVTVTAHVKNKRCILNILCKFNIKTKYRWTNTSLFSAFLRNHSSFVNPSFKQEHTVFLYIFIWCTWNTQYLSDVLDAFVVACHWKRKSDCILASVCVFIYVSQY